MSVAGDIDVSHVQLRRRVVPKQADRMHCTRPLCAVLLLLDLLVGPGCASEAADRSMLAVEDSAGITIVTSREPAWDSNGWSLSEQPVLQIGVIDGDSVYQLFRVRDDVRLSDGRIAIANDGSDELRYFDATGRHIRNVAHSGRGPGEFMSVSVIVPLFADSLIVGDFSLQRTTLLAPDGDVVRADPGAPPAGVLPDGSLVRQTRVMAQESVVRDGPARDEAILVRYRLGGTEADTIARMPGNESVQVVDSDGTVAGITGYRRPFGLMRMTSIGNGGIFTADGSSPEIRMLDRTGALRRILRYNHANRKVTPLDEAAYRERFLGPIPPGIPRQRAERALAGQAFPAQMPAFQSLRHDRVGNLWVEDYRADPADPWRWFVFDTEGQWLGSVAHFMTPGSAVSRCTRRYVILADVRDTETLGHRIALRAHRIEAS
jgi:hypothetical protein